MDGERRKFLATAAFTATGLIAASQAVAAPIPDAWDENFDVIVVGTGLAGMCAGITAAEKGAETRWLVSAARPSLAD